MERNLNKGIPVFIIAITCFLYGIYVFATGFMPLKSSKLGPSNLKDLPNEPFVNSIHDFEYNNLHKNRYRRIVVILIDSLRADFVIPHRSPFFSPTPFSHVSNFLINGQAIAFPCVAHSPTVTLPRIKTMLSGTLPSFLDFFINFNAEKLIIDNLVMQMYNNNRKILFYGDNTWINLFPREFSRQEGTHSFYVPDYKEVDDNVTRHLDTEIKRNDWNVMILHYLGVDHIGHAHGPNSPLMPVKLREMDNIIFKIYSGLKATSNGSGDLIVLCSDHGMTLTGNHGGNSKSELETPLIFINTEDWKFKISNLSRAISQVDIAVTLSVLMGLPIPSNSMGVIIPEVLQFSGMTNREVLYAAYYNMRQLSLLRGDIFSYSENLFSSSVQEIFKRHSKWLKYTSNDSPTNIPDYLYLLNIYLENLHKIKQILVANASGYKTDIMQIGMALAWTATSFFIIGHSKFVLSICFSTLMFISYALLHDFVSCICFIIITVNIFYLLKEIVFFVSSKSSQGKQRVFFLLLPILGSASSSFVEEEHQIWYFLCSTMLLVHMMTLLPSFGYLLRIISLKHNRIEALKAYQKSLPSIESPRLFFIPVLLLVIHRLFRAWNQTGNKWAHLHDLCDWLSEQQNSTTLHVLLILSLIALYFLFTKIFSCKTIYIIISAIVWIYLYKCQNHLVKWLCGTFKFCNGNVFAPRMLYLHAIVFCIMAIACCIRLTLLRFPLSCLKLMRYLIACIISGWTIITLTISHTENIPLIVGLFLQEFLLNEVTWKYSRDTFSNMTNYMIMAMCSFFYVGNSNSPSTIDVFAAYTGLTTYYPLFVSILLVCNTYNCYVLWLLMAFYRLFYGYGSSEHSNTYDSDIKAEVISSCHGILFYRMLMLCIYIVLVYCQRYHLFILSVFAPKFFYEIFHMLICVGVVCIVFVSSP